MKEKIDRTGEVGYNNQGLKMEIIEYKNAIDMMVKFENGYIAKNVSYGNFKNGTIKNPYFPSVFGMGYIGEGNYKTKNNGKTTKIYKTWQNMLRRCYNDKDIIKNPTYKNCSVCKEWHNFQNFAEWFDKNYYEIENERMELDKDILIKGNKIYSPNKCVFVPQNINNLFIKNDINRGSLPIGVQKLKKCKKFSATCGDFYIGIFDTPEEAFDAYKEFKENYIKQIADKYKNKIPKKLYNAMYNREVNIND